MNGFFEHQYLTYKKRHMMNLIALARTDGDFHDKEMQILYKIGKKYQLKEKHIAALLSSDAIEKQNYSLSHDQSLEQLYDLVEMMLADGKIEDSEILFCENMVRTLGYKPDLLAKLIDFVKYELNDIDVWKDFKETCIHFKIDHQVNSTCLSELN